MSPRAAWRLRELGFREVYDYVAGKSDWLAAGLPIEGELAAVPRAIDAVRRHVPTCRLRDLAADVRRRLKERGESWCVVTNKQGIVFGRVRWNALEKAADTTPVEQIMEAGPTTTRASDPLESLVERLREARVRRILVTTPEGVLLGAVYREDAERHLAGRG
jgi:CBS-domain-containing membrane protein